MLAFAPLDAAVRGASHLLVPLTHALEPLTGAAAAGAAVVAFTVGVRLLLAPLSYAQARAARRGNGLAGCLPALLQAPFFLVMYRLFAAPPPEAAAFLGIPLGHRLLDGLPAAAVPVYLVLFGLLAGLAWWFSRRMRRAAALLPAQEAPPGAATVRRVMALLPYGTVAAATVLPLAAVLYLATTTAWTALETLVLRGPAAGAGG